MASVVEADLGQLKVIFGLYAAYDRAIDTSNIHAEIARAVRLAESGTRSGKVLLVG